MQVRSTAAQEEEILAALTATPPDLRVGCDTDWSFATVWRRAESAGIELTAGREAKGLPAAVARAARPKSRKRGGYIRM